MLWLTQQIESTVIQSTDVVLQQKTAECLFRFSLLKEAYSNSLQSNCVALRKLNRTIWWIGCEVELVMQRKRNVA